MPKKVNKNALALLRDVAECRMLTLSQLAILGSRSKRSARRRMQELCESGHIESLPVKTGTGPDRPETVYGLGQTGYSLLKSEETLSTALAFEQISGRPLLAQAAHQIVLNWCRIHLLHLTKVFPRVSVEFVSCNSPFALDTDNGYALVRDSVSETDGEDSAWFTPDAAMAITDLDRSVTVPFFLEVDMGTETLSGSGPNDIEGKILRYQQYFRSSGYKRYEQIWGSELQGFRLLFVANTPERADSLGSFVQTMPPSDFVWLTDQASMYEEGISGKVWVRGGVHSLGRQSILGTLWRPRLVPRLEAR